MRRSFKKILKNSPWVITTIVALATWALFLWMMFGWVLETAAFHTAMNYIAG